MSRSTLDVCPRGWLVVQTLESGKKVFTTQRPSNAGFGTNSFTTQALLSMINSFGINNVIRGNHTITFTIKDGLLYCLCTTLAEQPKRLERQQMCLEEIARLCQLLIGQSHSLISAQMDGSAQGLARRIFWNVKPFIDQYLDDRLFCVAPNLRWVGAIPEDPENIRQRRFQVKCATLGAFLVLRLREPEPPTLVYQSKSWKQFNNMDKKLFIALGDALGRKYSTSKYNFNTVKLHVGKIIVYLTIMSIPKEFGARDLVLIRVTGKTAQVPSDQLLNRIVKYSKRAPTILEKLRRRVS